MLAPDETGGDRRVNLFLYRVEENPFLRNQDFAVDPGDANQLVPPPLSLNLFYLLTRYAPNDTADRQHDGAPDPRRGDAGVPREPGGPARSPRPRPAGGPASTCRSSCNTLDPEELSRIWTTFAQPFRLSVLYQVSTVQLDRLGRASDRCPGGCAGSACPTCARRSPRPRSPR